MAIIHIQEVNSDQVTEIIAETVEKALWAYTNNACFKWSEWAGTTVEYYPKSDMIKRMVFMFDNEQLTLCNVYGERFTAEWE